MISIRCCAAILLSIFLANCKSPDFSPAFLPPAPQEIGRTALHATLGLAHGLSVLPIEVRRRENVDGVLSASFMSRIVGSAGYIEGIGLVTAAHAARGEAGVLVFPNGEFVPFEVLRETGDLAILRGGGPVRLPLGGCPEIGDVVGLMGVVPPYIIFGRVIDIRRKWTVDGVQVEGFIVRAQIRPGFSGGPVIDAQGRAVGVNSAVDNEHQKAYVSYLDRVGGPQCMGGSPPRQQNSPTMAAFNNEINPEPAAESRLAR